MMNNPATNSHAEAPVSQNSPPPKRRRRYPSDLTDRQWHNIAPLLPPPVERGRQRQIDLREVLNGINFRWTTGCVWRMLPHDLPLWSTIYSYYRRWQRAGLLPQIREELTRRTSRQRRSLRRPFSSTPRTAAGTNAAWKSTNPATPAPDHAPPTHRGDPPFPAGTQPRPGAAGDFQERACESPSIQAWQGRNNVPSGNARGSEESKSPEPR